jgi:hypothetical protein
MNSEWGFGRKPDTILEGKPRKISIRIIDFPGEIQIGCLQNTSQIPYC